MKYEVTLKYEVELDPETFWGIDNSTIERELFESDPTQTLKVDNVVYGMVLNFISEGNYYEHVTEIKCDVTKVS